MAITRVSTIGTASASTTGTTLDITVPVGGVAAGNHVIFAARSNGTVTWTSVTDSKGNTYQLDRVLEAQLSNRNVMVASSRLGTALVSGDTITVTVSASTAPRHAAAYEYAGLATSAWLDQTNAAVGSSTTPDSGSITTTQADELLFGATEFANVGGYAPDAAWTELNEVALTRTLQTQERIVSATETRSSTGTITTGNWGAIIASYKASVAPPPTPPDAPAGFFDPGLNVRTWF